MKAHDLVARFATAVSRSDPMAAARTSLGGAGGAHAAILASRLRRLRGAQRDGTSRSIGLVRSRSP